MVSRYHRFCPNCKGDLRKRGCTHHGLQPVMNYSAESFSAGRRKPIERTATIPLRILKEWGFPDFYSKSSMMDEYHGAWMDWLDNYASRRCAANFYVESSSEPKALTDREVRYNMMCHLCGLYEGECDCVYDPALHTVRFAESFSADVSAENKAHMIWEMVQQNLNNPLAVEGFYATFFGEDKEYYDGMGSAVIEAVKDLSKNPEWTDAMVKEYGLDSCVWCGKDSEGIQDGVYWCRKCYEDEEGEVWDAESFSAEDEWDGKEVLGQDMMELLDRVTLDYAVKNRLGADYEIYVRPLFMVPDRRPHWEERGWIEWERGDVSRWWITLYTDRATPFASVEMMPERRVGGSLTMNQPAHRAKGITAEYDLNTKKMIKDYNPLKLPPDPEIVKHFLNAESFEADGDVFYGVSAFVDGEVIWNNRTLDKWDKETALKVQKDWLASGEFDDVHVYEYRDYGGEYRSRMYADKEEVYGAESFSIDRTPIPLKPTKPSDPTRPVERRKRKPRKPWRAEETRLQKIQNELAQERTELSMVRSDYSAKRTAMSGIRTLLAVITFGVVLATFNHERKKEK